MSSESYLIGVRIGYAQGAYNILEKILSKHFTVEYRKYKHKLRKLAEVEVDELLTELIVSKDVESIKKYIG